MEKKYPYRLLALLFVLGITAAAVINFIWPDRSFSEQENRTLSQMPKFSAEAVLNGTFMDDFEDYLSDQFVGRSIARRIYTAYERIGGTVKSNDVIVCKGGQLVEDISVPTDEHVADLAYALVSFKERYPDVNMTMLIAPDAAAVLSSELPSYVTVADQKEIIDKLQSHLQGQFNWVDCYDSLRAQKKSLKLYYKTDHHWTTTGAYETFLAAGKSMGIENPEEITYESRVVTDSFNGILSSTSGFDQSETDEIEVYLSSETPAYVVTYVESGEQTASVYKTEKLTGKDKYGVFFGGNYSLMDIDIASNSGHTLLVVKDSFANCFIPFLIPYYSRIVVVDPRYYSSSVTDLMGEYQVTDVLFLYSGNTFFTDKNIEGFLQ